MRVSLEQFNVFKGYTRNNVCLIYLEFNTSDKSVIYKNNDSENSGWSKEKFAFFVEKNILIIKLIFILTFRRFILKSLFKNIKYKI